MQRQARPKTARPQRQERVEEIKLKSPTNEMRTSNFNLFDSPTNRESIKESPSPFFGELATQNAIK